MAGTPWFLGGDFSTVLRVSERRRGLIPDSRSIQDFQECLAATNLQRFRMKGDNIHGIIIKQAVGESCRDWIQWYVMERLCYNSLRSRLTFAEIDFRPCTAVARSGATSTTSIEVYFSKNVDGAP